MALLRASVVMAGTFGQGSTTARRNLGASNALVISATPFWSKRPAVIKNAPYTIDHPSRAQLDIRIKFGDLAVEAHNTRQVNLYGLPGAAGYIQQKLTNAHGAGALPKGQWPSSQKHTLHTLAELKKMAGAPARGPVIPTQMPPSEYMMSEYYRGETR
jgi:hypothetical protein